MCSKQGDASKAKTKVWQNKNKAAKKAAKSKKKKLTKKKATPAPSKSKQANGNVAGNVSTSFDSGVLSFWKQTSLLHELFFLMLTSQEVVPAAAKDEDDEASDKGSDSDEGEANKDSPSERDEDSDKQSDTEVDEIGGDDEEVRGRKKKITHQCNVFISTVRQTSSSSFFVRNGRRCSRVSSGESEPCWRQSQR